MLCRYAVLASLWMVCNKYTDPTTTALSLHPLPVTQQIQLQFEETMQSLLLVHRNTGSPPNKHLKFGGQYAHETPNLFYASTTVRLIYRTEKAPFRFMLVICRAIATLRHYVPMSLYERSTNRSTVVRGRVVLKSGSSRRSPGNKA